VSRFNSSTAAVIPQAGVQNWLSEVGVGDSATEQKPAVSLKDPKVLIGAASIVAVMVVLLLVTILGTGPTTVATLKVDSTPVRVVNVFIDGERVGSSTPLYLDKIERGKHEIRIEAKGFRTYRQSFDIQENRPHTLDIPLIKKAPMPVAAGQPVIEAQIDAGVADGRAPIIVTAPPVVTRVVPNWNLQIISRPRGAKVSIDGTGLGRAPLYRRGIPPDRGINVVLEMDGYQKYEERIRPPIEAGSTVRFRGILKPANPPPAAAPPKSAPMAAPVLGKDPNSNERKAPAAPRAQRAPPPKKKVSSEAEPRKSPKKRTKIIKNDKKSGYLMLTTIPKGLEVIIDGKPTGLKSPFRKPYRLSPGKHSVTMTGRSGRAQTFTVTISPGGTTKLVKRIR